MGLSLHRGRDPLGPDAPCQCWWKETPGIWAPTPSPSLSAQNLPCSERRGANRGSGNPAPTARRRTQASCLPAPLFDIPARAGSQPRCPGSQPLPEATRPGTLLTAGIEFRHPGFCPLPPHPVSPAILSSLPREPRPPACASLGLVLFALHFFILSSSVCFFPAIPPVLDWQVC